MSHVAVATSIIQIANLAFELIGTGNLILNRLYQRQQERLAEGKELTDEDVIELMGQGDVKAAVEKAHLAQALLAKQTS